jgi:hypothetical protein
MSPEPPVKMTLIDEPEVGRNSGDRLAMRHPALGLLEADLKVVGVQRQTEHPLKLSCELKPAHIRHTRQVRCRDRVADVIVEVVANPANGVVPQYWPICPGLHRSKRNRSDDAFEALAAFERHGRLGSGEPGDVDFTSEHWIVDEWRIRDQILRRVMSSILNNSSHEVCIDIQHAIGVAARGARSAIVHLTGIEDDHVAGTAVMRRAPAPEPLNTAQRDAHC